MVEVFYAIWDVLAIVRVGRGLSMSKGVCTHSEMMVRAVWKLEFVVGVEEGCPANH